MEFLKTKIKAALVEKGSVGVSTLIELKEYCRSNNILNSKLEKLIQEETEKHKASKTDNRPNFENRLSIDERPVFSRADYDFNSSDSAAERTKSDFKRTEFKPRAEYLREETTAQKQKKEPVKSQFKVETKTDHKPPKQEKINFTRPKAEEPKQQKQTTQNKKTEQFVEDFEFEERIQSKVNQQNKDKTKAKAKRKAKKTQTYSAIMNEEVNKFQKYIFIAIIAGFIIPFVPIVAGFYLKGKVTELKEGHNYLYLNNVDKKRVDMTLNLCYIAIGVGFFMLFSLKNFL